MNNLTQLELYTLQQERLPKKGKSIIGNFTENSIIVYQAFNNQISNYAIDNQNFGGDYYSFSRMTWIKPGFMWMMYRSGWASKKDQERILTIELKMEGFLEILRNATHSSFQPDIFNTKEDWQQQLKTHKVRLQWDPDHNPKGAKLERKAMQLGLKDKILEQFNNEWIINIEDITEFVKKQYQNVLYSIEKLEVPVENVLDLNDTRLERQLGVSK
jgi:hypothetical protein